MKRISLEQLLKESGKLTYPEQYQYIIEQTEKFLLKMNDASEIAVDRWIPESEEDIKAVIVFSHGMQEHSLRYDRIGSIFAENGFVFNAHDHRGHGKTAQNAEQNGTGI